MTVRLCAGFGDAEVIFVAVPGVGVDGAEAVDVAPAELVVGAGIAAGPAAPVGPRVGWPIAAPLTAGPF